MPKKTFFKLPSKNQKEIIDTAMEVYIHEKFEDITIRSLSERLNLSIGSFYDYFQDKDEVYFYIFDSLINRLLFSGYYKDRMFTVPRPDLKDYLSQREIDFYNTFRSAPEYMMKKYYFDWEVNGPYFQYVQREFEHMKWEGKIRDGLDVDFMAYLYGTLSFNVAMYFERTFSGAPFEQKYSLCNQMYEMFQHGLFEPEIAQSDGGEAGSGNK